MSFANVTSARGAGACARVATVKAINAESTAAAGASRGRRSLSIATSAGILLQRRRPAVMRRLLVRVSEREHLRVGPQAAEKRHAHRKAAPDEAGGHRPLRQAGPAAPPRPRRAGGGPLAAALLRLARRPA